MKKTIRSEALKTKARAFAVAVVRLAGKLRKRREAVLAAQFLRSGTSIGANLAEGRYSLTRGDRLAKHAIALKEAGETLYWLELFTDLGVITSKSEFASMHDDCQTIIDLLKRTISYDRHMKQREERAARLSRPSRRRAETVAPDGT